MLLSDLERGVSPEGIVAFTYTEKAADELLSRIHSIAAQYLPNVDLAGLFVGTIHSWCLRYLLDQNRYYGFTPLDELQVDALASRLYDYFDVATSYGKPYPKGIKKFLADLEVFYNEGLDLESVPLQIRESIGRFLGVLEGNRLLTFGSMVNNARVHLEQAGGGPAPSTLNKGVSMFPTWLYHSIENQPAHARLASAELGTIVPQNIE